MNRWNRRWDHIVGVLVVLAAAALIAALIEGLYG